MYDLVIVGAGPAGSTLARVAGSRLRTLLVERRPDGPAQPGPRSAKCCGGLLAPEAQRALAALGLGVPREVLIGPQLFAVRAIDVASGIERHYPRHYLNVDRGRFDAWLRTLVPAEVEVRTGHLVTGLCDEGDGVALALESTGGTEIVRARLVVGADGAASRVRARAFPGAEATAMARGLGPIAAHASTMAKYGASPFALYPLSVIQAYPQRFNANWVRFWKCH